MNPDGTYVDGHFGFPALRHPDALGAVRFPRELAASEPPSVPEMSEPPLGEGLASQAWTFVKAFMAGKRVAAA